MRFQYLTDAQYLSNGKTFAGASSKDCAESLASIGKGNSPVPVHADLTGLDPEGRYRYRFLAANKYGESPGAAVLFGAPLLTIKPALPVLYAEATLRAACRALRPRHQLPLRVRPDRSLWPEHARQSDLGRARIGRRLRRPQRPRRRPDLPLPHRRRKRGEDGRGPRPDAHHPGSPPGRILPEQRIPQRPLGQPARLPRLRAHHPRGDQRPHSLRRRHRRHRRRRLQQLAGDPARSGRGGEALLLHRRHPAGL